MSDTAFQSGPAKSGSTRATGGPSKTRGGRAEATKRSAEAKSTKPAGSVGSGTATPVSAPTPPRKQAVPAARGPAPESSGTSDRQTEERQTEVRVTEVRETEVRETEVRETEVRDTDQAAAHAAGPARRMATKQSWTASDADCPRTVTVVVLQETLFDARNRKPVVGLPVSLGHDRRGITDDRGSVTFPGVAKGTSPTAHVPVLSGWTSCTTEESSSQLTILYQPHRATLTLQAVHAADCPCGAGAYGIADVCVAAGSLQDGVFLAHTTATSDCDGCVPFGVLPTAGLFVLPRSEITVVRDGNDNAAVDPCDEPAEDHLVLELGGGPIAVRGGGGQILLRYRHLAAATLIVGSAFEAVDSSDVIPALPTMAWRLYSLPQNFQVASGQLGSSPIELEVAEGAYRLNVDDPSMTGWQVDTPAIKMLVRGGQRLSVTVGIRASNGRALSSTNDVVLSGLAEADARISLIRRLTGTPLLTVTASNDGMYQMPLSDVGDTTRHGLEPLDLVAVGTDGKELGRMALDIGLLNGETNA
jgi:hypothetical protein